MNNAHISSDINHMCRQCAAYQMASVCLWVAGEKMVLLDKILKHLIKASNRRFIWEYMGVFLMHMWGNSGTHHSTDHTPVMTLCTKDVEMFFHFQAFL